MKDILNNYSKNITKLYHNDMQNFYYIYLIVYSIAVIIISGLVGFMVLK